MFEETEGFLEICRGKRGQIPGNKLWGSISVEPVLKDKSLYMPSLPPSASCPLASPGRESCRTQVACLQAYASLSQCNCTNIYHTDFGEEGAPEAHPSMQQETWVHLWVNLFFSALFLKIHFSKIYGLQVSEKGSSKETPSGVNEKNYINHSKFSMKLHCQPQRRKMLFHLGLTMFKDPLFWVFCPSTDT